MGRVRDWWGSRHATRIWAGRSLVNLHQGRRVGRKRRLSLWSTGWKDHAPSGETKFKPEMAQSITDAISTSGNRGMWWNNSVFCNELTYYAVRIAKCLESGAEHDIWSLQVQVPLWPLSWSCFSLNSSSSHLSRLNKANWSACCQLRFFYVYLKYFLLSVYMACSRTG